MAAVQFIDLGDEIQRDPRGMSFFPWQGRLHDPQDLLKTFHLVSLSPGVTRGNHLHPGHTEWLYLFHGEGLMIWEAAPGQVREKLISGNQTLIQVPPGIAHAVKNLGPEILYLLAWREQTGEAGAAAPETVRHEVQS